MYGNTVFIAPEDVHVWAFKGFLSPYFGVFICTVMILGPCESSTSSSALAWRGLAPFHVLALTLSMVAGFNTHQQKASQVPASPSAALLRAIWSLFDGILVVSEGCRGCWSIQFCKESCFAKRPDPHSLNLIPYPALGVW